MLHCVWGAQDSSTFKFGVEKILKNVFLVSGSNELIQESVLFSIYCFMFSCSLVLVELGLMHPKLLTEI